MRHLFTVLALVVLSTSPAFAITPEESRIINHGTVFYEPGFNSCYTGGEGGELGENIPEPYRSLFNQAANEYDVDSHIMAVVFYWENRGFPPPDKDWATSSGGAKGPWQFLDNTWSGYGVDANEDGIKDVQNLEDATFGAANYIKSLGGVSGLELGGLTQDFSRENADKETVAWVLKSYNAGPATYRNETTKKWFRRKNGSDTNWGSSKQIEINEYIENGTLKYAEFSGGVSAGSQGSASGACGSLGISSDGFVFPLKITKSKLAEGARGAVWNMLRGDCRNNSYGCHGKWGGPTDDESDDTKFYYAADIHAETGTPVVAARNGSVHLAHVNSDGAFAVVLKGDDSNYYYYTHMSGDYRPITKGDPVSAGQIIGEVGTSAETGNGSAPHVHFDVATQNVGSRYRGCAESNCSGMNYLIDPYEILMEAYGGLDE